MSEEDRKILFVLLVIVYLMLFKSESERPRA